MVVSGSPSTGRWTVPGVRIRTLLRDNSILVAPAVTRKVTLISRTSPRSAALSRASTSNDVPAISSRSPRLSGGTVLPCWPSSAGTADAGAADRASRLRGDGSCGTRAGETAGAVPRRGGSACACAGAGAGARRAWMIGSSRARSPVIAVSKAARPVSRPGSVVHQERSRGGSAMAVTLLSLVQAADPAWASLPRQASFRPAPAASPVEPPCA